MTVYDYQLGFAGDTRVAVRSVADKVRYVLDTYPETRQDDNLLVWMYWQEFCDLRPLLALVAKYTDAKDIDTAFQLWLTKATSAETITRRRREWNEDGEALPPAAVVEERERKSRLGASRFHRG
jgi:hypothetical protein